MSKLLIKPKLGYTKSTQGDSTASYPNSIVEAIYWDNEEISLEEALKRMQEAIDGGGGASKNAVLYVEQTLTPEQQLQAQKNIGIGLASEEMPADGMLPNVVYNLGVLDSDTEFVLASAEGQMNHYFWVFETGSVVPEITWPESIRMWENDEEPTIAANKHYEISVLDGAAAWMVCSIPGAGPDYSEPLTFEATEDDTEVKFYLSPYYEGDDEFEVEASTDGGSTWTPVKATVDGALVATLGAGEKVLLRGDNEAYGFDYDGDAANIINFNASAPCYVYGNIMSLLSSDGYEDLKVVAPYSFAYFFSDYDEERSGEWVLSKENSPLLLPATTLAVGCYSSMFNLCTSLVEAPALPATTLAEGCYSSMFNLCTSLVEAPALPATTLAEGCYSSMFGYASLVEAPALPATTLADYCYTAMFESCESLTEAPELPATTLAVGCYSNMFYGCTSLVEAPALPATTLAERCYESILSNCTSLVEAPALPATTLAEYCYDGMFYGCTSLTEAPELPATTLAEGCYSSMFAGCTSLDSVECLATDISASGALGLWLRGVAASGTFTKAAGVNWPSGDSGIPSGWIVVEV